jgi:predicted ester cyclase
MTVAENIEMVRQYWKEVWNQGSAAAVPKFYAPDCIHGKNFTIEGFQKNVAETRLEFPDFAVTIDDIFGLDNKVVSRVTYNGTHTGSTDGSPPTGAQLTYSGLISSIWKTAQVCGALAFRRPSKNDAPVRRRRRI